jgi:hypothetical protein
MSSATMVPVPITEPVRTKRLIEFASSPINASTLSCGR